MRLIYSILLFLYTVLSAAQPSPTSSASLMAALQKKATMANTSLVKNIPLQNIGPSVMSGRVVDLAVNPENPVEFYVAYASGGLWYTQNNGTSFIPVLDNSGTQNIGDVAVHWESGTIWVGTGENNASRSSYAGIGVLKSTDRGKTWSNMGLTNSHHIGRILVNPKNPDDVLVGVTGPLYSPEGQRGVFRTDDGGKTWERTLFIGPGTGIIDLEHAPSNFDILYAAAWQKDRKAWNFNGSGTNSGIYKSLDGGQTWTKTTPSTSGFPQGAGVGRIGLAVFDEHTLYAVLDNQFRRDKTKPKEEEVLTAKDFKTMSKDDFLGIDDKKLNDFLKTKGFHEKYKAENVKNMVRDGAVAPVDLANYLEDANSLLFDTPVIGAEVYRSEDGGQTWTKQNEQYIDDLFYSYGYYFGLIRVDPLDREKIYLGGVPILKSKDGGKTFGSISGNNVHADHHALWINPNRPGHLINGNDGGVNISYDDGKSWIKNNSPTVGQFYAIQIDNDEPYNVYGGLQDNGVWKGAHNAKEDSRWQQTGHYPWEMIMGGDGMQVQVDKRDPNLVYTGFQFGNYYRLQLDTGVRKAIQPKHELGEIPLRFNWQTPILLSSHNQDILYMGSQRLHRSLNQGTDWVAISPDLTQGGKKGNVAYGTLTTISESPLQFGLLYTGSDDGLIHVSPNGGASWTEIGENMVLPGLRGPNGPKDAELWISRVAASKHKKERVYASLNGYRWDDFTPYILVSEDMGKTWKSIAEGIPTAAVNVLLEDTQNENLLFVGTDNGLYVSFDRGSSWELFQNGMPNVAVHDLVIQPREKHLLVGTHGRSIYKADISHLQQMTPQVRSQELHIFDLDTLAHSKSWGNFGNAWDKPSTPGLEVVFYSDQSTTVSAVISTLDGIPVSSTEVKADKGLNILSYDVAFSKSGKMAYLKKYKTKLKVAEDGKTYLPKGSYEVLLEANGKTASTPFLITDSKSE